MIILRKALNFVFILFFCGTQTAAAYSAAANRLNATLASGAPYLHSFNKISPRYQATLLACEKIESSLGSLKLGKVNILRLAEIGQQLSEHFRNDGNIKMGAKAHAISLSAYDSYCGVLRYWVSKQSNNSVLPLEDKKWSVLADAKLFIEFSLFSANSSKDKLLESRVLNRYWQYYNAIGQNLQAEAVIKKSLNLLLDQSHDPDEYIDAILKLNTVLKRLGKYSENIKYLASAMRLKNQISEKNLELLFFSAGFLNRDLGQFDIAQRYFKLSIESYKTQRIGESETENCKTQYIRHLDVGKTYTQMALVARLQNKLDEAKIFLQCAHWFLALHEDYYKLVAEIEEARLANIDGKYPIAFKQSQTILKDVRILPMQRLDALLVSLESVLELKNAKVFEFLVAELAALFGYQSLKEPKEIEVATENYPIRQILAFRLLIDWSTREGNVERAYEFYRIAQLLMQNIRNQTLVPQAWDAARYSLVDTFVKTVWLARETSETNADLASRLWDILEKFQLSQLEREKRLLSWSIDEERDRLAYESWITAKRELFFAPQESKQKAQRIADVAEASFFKDSLFHSNQQRESDSLTIKEIKNSLSGGQVLLRYFVGSELSFVLIVDKHSVNVKKLKNHNELSAIFAKYDGVVSNSPQGVFSDTYITSLLPKNTIISGGYNKIYVMPDGILHQLPFAAINLSESKRYIPVTVYAEVVNIQAASEYFSPKVMTRFAEYQSISIFAASDNPNRLIKVTRANHSFDVIRKYSALRGVRIETEAIQKNFVGKNIQLGTGNDATNAFLMSKGTRTTDILHIATHGIYDPNTPGNNGLLTHDPENGLSTLTHSELMSRPFTSKLVVISGCETMQGTLHKGSGMHSLSRSFLAQGATAVIGTLWPVNDAPTVRFMSDFYKNLVESQSPSQALMKTKRKFSQYGRYKHPKYWAGFILSEREQLLRKEEKEHLL